MCMCVPVNVNERETDRERNSSHHKGTDFTFWFVSVLHVERFVLSFIWEFAFVCALFTDTKKSSGLI